MHLFEHELCATDPDYEYKNFGGSSFFAVFDSDLDLDIVCAYPDTKLE